MLSHIGIALLTCGILGFSSVKQRLSFQEKACTYDVNFSLETDSLWSLPTDASGVPIDLSLKIENLAGTSLRFPLMDNYHLYIKYDDGSITDMTGGLDNLIPSKPISDPVNHEGSYFLRLKGKLWKRADDQIQLTFYDEFGYIWQLGPLKDQLFWLGMTYSGDPGNQQEGSEFWCGEADIGLVRISIR